MAAPLAAQESADALVGSRFNNGIVAQVENRIITVGDVRREIQPVLPQIVSQSRTQAEFEKTLQETEDVIIQGLVDNILIVKDFYSDEKRQIPANVIEDEVKTDLIVNFDNDRAKWLAYLKAIGKNYHEYRDMKKEDIIIGWMKSQKRKSQTVVSPVQLENYYTENRDKFYQGDSVNLRIIRLHQIADEPATVLQQTAESIMRDLRSGKDFAELARQYSQDSSKTRGGDWGWMAKSDMREEFAEVAFKFDKGQFSEPVKIDDDIYIFYIEDKRVAGIQPLDEVRDQIEQTLVQQMQNEAQERWLERLRREAFIRYY